MDLFSSKLVGWAMRDHLRTELAATALMMAVRRQRPAASESEPASGIVYFGRVRAVSNRAPLFFRQSFDCNALFASYQYHRFHLVVTPGQHQKPCVPKFWPIRPSPPIGAPAASLVPGVSPEPLGRA